MELHPIAEGLPGVPSYARFRIKTKGKSRVAWAPNKAMREVHRRFLDYLESREVGLRCPSATGSVPGGSPLRNAVSHRGNRFFFVLDIKGAYGSVDLEELAWILSAEGAGDPEELLDFLFSFCSADGRGLCLGGPLSPILFNIYCEHRLDRAIRLHVARFRRKIVYTRYVDDLTISAPVPLERRLRGIIRDKIELAGFTINERKVRILDIKKHPVVITGIGLREDGGLFLSKKKLERVLGLLNKTHSFSPEEDQSVLFGTVSYVVELVSWMKKHGLRSSAKARKAYNRFLFHKGSRADLRKGD